MFEYLFGQLESLPQAELSHRANFNIHALLPIVEK